MFSDILGIVMEVTPDSFYKIGTKTGALSNLYSRSQIAPCTANLLKISDVPNTTISLRTANSLASVVGGQGFVRCTCNKKCINKRCVCKKKGVICNSRCHNSTNCTNK